MALTDTTEYWWDIKYNYKEYNGRQFRHNPHHKCNHYNPSSGNTNTTIYIGDINCFKCIENLNNGIASKEGLIEGNAPETFYMSNKEKKLFNKRKLFNEKYGVCSCGSSFQIRKNKSNGKEFLGCINYPKCKNTKSI